MAEIKYQYAYIDNDRENIISIKEINNENRKKYRFYCIGCGNELLPRAIGSKCRQAHFYHKETVECSGETYLHKLAKTIIKNKFDAQSEFLIEYPVTRECEKSENCPYHNEYCHEHDPMYQLDLKKYYDTCNEEVPIKDFKADLLLTKTNDSNRQPVLIEICVTHPCDLVKRNSGLRIIEIKVKNEQDIFDLKEKKILQEPDFGPLKEKKIEFISFKREVKEPRSAQIQRYLYNPKQEINGSFQLIDCAYAKYRLRTDSLTELNVVIPKGYTRSDVWVPLSWILKKKGIRRCYYCKFYGKRRFEPIPVCKLSKYGKPEHPSMEEAERCRSYSFDHISSFDNYNSKTIIEEIDSNAPLLKPEYKVILAASNTFTDYKLFCDKFNYYLANKIQTHTLVIIMGISKILDIFINEISKDNNIIKETHTTDWGKYDKAEAIKVSNDEMTNNADALIAFWDGKSPGICNLIEQAEKKGIKVAKVLFDPKEQQSI